MAVQTFSDGSIPYGTRHIDFYPQTAPAANGQPSSYAGAVKKGTFTCENCEVSRPSFRVKQYNEVRKPSGQFAIDDFDGGSCVVQIYDVNVQIHRYDAFQITFDSIIGAESFWVASVSAPEGQGEYRKQNVTFEKLVSVAGPTATV